MGEKEFWNFHCNDSTLWSLLNSASAPPQLIMKLNDVVTFKNVSLPIPDSIITLRSASQILQLSRKTNKHVSFRLVFHNSTGNLKHFPSVRELSNRINDVFAAASIFYCLDDFNYRCGGGHVLENLKYFTFHKFSVFISARTVSCFRQMF